MHVPIKFASVKREAANKQKAPFAGFPVPGQRPIAVRRKVLAECIEGITDARVWIDLDYRGMERRECHYGRPCLRIESADGKRRYALFTAEDFKDVRKEQHAFATRKASSRCRANGWKRVVEFSEGDETTDGQKSEYFIRAGLKIVGRTVFHAASGKSILIASDRTQAFTAAEHVLSVVPDWTQDAESILRSVGAERLNRLRAIQSKCRLGNLNTAPRPEEYCVPTPPEAPIQVHPEAPAREEAPTLPSQAPVSAPPWHGTTVSAVSELRPPYGGILRNLPCNLSTWHMERSVSISSATRDGALSNLSSPPPRRGAALAPAGPRQKKRGRDRSGAPESVPTLYPHPAVGAPAICPHPAARGPAMRPYPLDCAPSQPVPWHPRRTPELAISRAPPI